MIKLKKKTAFLVQSALIAAIYTVLTLIPGISAISYGPIQCRIAEALCVLPMLTSAAIPGLFVGCILSNALGVAMGLNPTGFVDILFGASATLIAAIVSYFLRNVAIKGFPALSFLSPVIFNAVIIGAELAVFIPEAGAYWLNFTTVGIGELIVICALGIPLFYICKRKNIFNKGRF